MDFGSTNYNTDESLQFTLPPPEYTRLPSRYTQSEGDIGGVGMQQNSANIIIPVGTQPNELFKVLNMNQNNDHSLDNIFKMAKKSMDTKYHEDNANKEELLTSIITSFKKLCDHFRYNIPEYMTMDLNRMKTRLLESMNFVKNDPSYYVLKKDARTSELYGRVDKKSVRIEEKNIDRDNRVVEEKTFKKVNPIRKEKYNTALTINTKYRNNYYGTKSTDFLFALPDPIKNVASLKISNIELKNTHYTVSNYLKTNVFYVRLDDTKLSIDELTITDIVISGTTGTVTYSGDIRPTAGQFVRISDLDEKGLNKAWTVVTVDTVDTGAKKFTFNVTEHGFTKTGTFSNAKGNLCKIYKIEIPDGNYTPQEMVHTINGDGGLVVGYGLKKANASTDLTGVIKATYEATTKKIIFSEVSTVGRKFDLDFELKEGPERDIAENLGWLLGYRQSYYNYDQDTDNSDLPYYRSVGINTLTNESIITTGFQPEAPADFTGSKFFLIEVDDFNNSVQSFYYPCTFNSLKMKDLLGKIPSEESGVGFYEDSSIQTNPTRYYMGPVNIEKLHIRIVDEHGVVVDLNNVDFSITFNLEVLNVHYDMLD